MCLADGDRTAQSGGKCLPVGDQMCGGPRHLECKYPSAQCGGQICEEREVAPPP